MSDEATGVLDPPESSSITDDSLYEGGFDALLGEHVPSGEGRFPDDFEGNEDLNPDPPEAGDEDTEDGESPPSADADDTETDADEEEEDEEYIPGEDPDEWGDEDYEDEEEEDEYEDEEGSESDESDESDEDEEEEEEEEELEGEEEEDESTEQFSDAKPFTKKDREAIKKNPELQRAYKAMQSRFSERMAENATERRELRAQREEVTRFRERMHQPQKFADMLSKVMTERPDIAGAAFDGALNSKQQESVLLSMAVSNPELFEKVQEQSAELQTDENAMKRYKDEQDMSARRRELARRERQLNRRTFQRNAARIETQAVRLARNLRIEKSDMQFVKEDLESAYRSKIQKNGDIDFSAKDIRASVRATKKRLDGVYKRIADRERKRTARQSQRKTKRRAAKAKKQKRRAPKGPQQRSARRQPVRRKPAKRKGPTTQRQRDIDLSRQLNRSVREKVG